MNTEFDITTTEGARKYLEAEGFNVDELVKEGVSFINTIKEKIKQRDMKKLTKNKFDQLKKDHEEGCGTNDYSKMIMSGDEKDIAMKEYIRDNNLCKHESIEEILGGQIERCRQCGKEW